MRHIALIAPMLSGKTTAADYLVERHGYRKIALADPLKEDVQHALNYMLRHYHLFGGAPRAGITRAEMDADKATFRPILQWWGTDFVRRWLGQDDWWVQRLLEAVAECARPVVCDDVRFPNEAAALKAAGFTLVRIVRPELTRRHAIYQRLWEQGVRDVVAEMDRALAHATETSHAAIDADVTIDNDAGLGKLRSSLDAVVRRGDVPTNYA